MLYGRYTSSTKSGTRLTTPWLDSLGRAATFCSSYCRAHRCCTTWSWLSSWYCSRAIWIQTWRFYELSWTATFRTAESVRFGASICPTLTTRASLYGLRRSWRVRLMWSLLEIFTSDVMHWILDLFVKDRALNCLFHTVKDSLRIMWIYLLPDEKSLSTIGSAIAIRTRNTVLREGL